MPKFNNKICYDNITAAYKAIGMKTGEFEKEIGASVGHFSRLVKEDGKLGMISAELLFNASDVLGIPVEILGSVDITEIDPTEKYYYDFLTKMINNTRSKELEWHSIKFDKMRVDKHLFTLAYETYDNILGHYTTYYSEFWPKDKYFCDLVGDALYFYQKTGYFILTKVKVENKDNGKQFFGYELYFKEFSESFKTKIVCSSPEQKEEINSRLEVLYKLIIEYLRLPKITNKLKLAIDSFMNNDNAEIEDVEVK